MSHPSFCMVLYSTFLCSKFQWFSIVWPHCALSTWTCVFGNTTGQSPPPVLWTPQLTCWPKARWAVRPCGEGQDQPLPSLDTSLPWFHFCLNPLTVISWPLVACGQDPLWHQPMAQQNQETCPFEAGAWFLGRTTSLMRKSIAQGGLLVTAHPVSPISQGRS